MTKRHEPTARGQAHVPARRLSVLSQCLEAGYNPVEGIIESRKKTKDVIEQLEFYLDKGGPAPWFVGYDSMSKGDGDSRKTARAMLAKAYEFLVDIDQQILPYCHPRQSAHAVTGEDGGPVQIQQIERVIVDPAAKPKRRRKRKADDPNA